MTLHHSFRFSHHAGRRDVVALVVATCLVALTAVAATAGEWTGEIQLQDGIRHVMNPGSPMEAPVTVELEELWRLGGDSDAEEEFFGVIADILVDEDENVYLLDSQLSEIKVFTPDGVFLRSIGRDGEGPGEFRLASDMFFTADGDIAVIQLAPGKIVRLTRSGDPAGTIPNPQPNGEGSGVVIMLNGNSAGDRMFMVLATNEFTEGSFNQTRRLIRFDSEGEIAQTFVTGVRSFDFANVIFDETVWDSWENRWDLGRDGRLYAAETWGEYAITVWSPEGTKEMVIHRDLEPRKRDAEELAYIEEVYKAMTSNVPNGQARISPVDHRIVRVFSRDDGTLWVLNTYGASDPPDGVLGTFDVFDRDGHFVREITLGGQGRPRQDGYIFRGDRLYVITGFLDAVMASRGAGPAGSDDGEPMAVICYRVNGII